MRILIINFEYPPLGGGGGVATRELAQALAARHQVHVITTHFKGLRWQEETGGVHIHRVAVWGRSSLPTASVISLLTFVPAALWQGLTLTRQHSFDIINAQFVVPSGIPAAIISRVRRVPFVVSFIGGDIYDPTKRSSPHRYAFFRATIRAVARRASAGTAISSDTKEHARELHGITLPITVTPLGIKPTAVPPASRTELGLPREGEVFVSIGRLIPRKGFAELIRLWPDVPGAYLVIIGDGPERQALLSLATKLGVHQRVLLLGFLSEQKKLQVLQHATVYLSAAAHEGFGIVFLEAMAAGLPIVATDNGGQTDFLQAGENALLVSPGDQPALLDAIHQMHQSSELRDHMSVNNRRKVKDFYIENVVHVFEDVLQQAAKTNV